MNQHKNQENLQRIRTKLSDISEIPKDASLGLPILTLLGKTELCLENYCGILEYTDNIIRIKTKIGLFVIKGHRLKMDYYLNDEMKVTGHIESMEFHE